MRENVPVAPAATTGANFAGWCQEVGFREVETLPLTGPARAGIAYK